MGDTRSETLSKLYTLRASLSLVVQKNEEVERIRRDIKSRDNAPREAIAHLEYGISKDKKRLKHPISYYYGNWDTYENTFNLLVALFLLPIMIVLMVGGTWLFISHIILLANCNAESLTEVPYVNWFYGGWYLIKDSSFDSVELFGSSFWAKLPNFIWYLIVTVGGFIVPPLIIVLGVYVISERKGRYKDDIKEYWGKTNLFNAPFRIFHDRRALSKKLKNDQQKMDAVKEAEHTNYWEREKWKKQQKAIIQSKIAEMKQIVTMCLKSNVLSSGDWDKIDALIYYVSSKRADTIKEALNCLDAQMRTETLLDAINQAHNSISTQLRSGFRNLSSGIDTMQRSIKTASETQQKQMAQLISEEKLQTALQRDISRSSADIAASVSDIRRRYY